MENKKTKKIGPLTQAEAEIEVKIDPTIELGGVDKKEFAALCGIGKSALHHYSSSSWTEAKMIIESILKDRTFDERLLKIVKVKIFIDDVNDWLADAKNFFLPMRNKRIGLYRRYPENLFQLYGLENIRPNRRELSMFLPSEADKKTSLEYSKAMQTKLSMYEEINTMIFEKTGLEPNREKLIERAKEAQKIILKFGDEQKKRQTSLHRQLSDDFSSQYYNRVDVAYASPNNSKEKIAKILKSIMENNLLSDGRKLILETYLQPENRV